MSAASSGRWLVTGATGFIGAHLVRAGLQRTIRVHGIIRPGSSLWRLHDVAGDVIWHEADLRDADAVRRAVIGARPNVVFHLAAPSGHPADDVARREMLSGITLGTLNLLEALRLESVSRFVHVGSGLEYGSNGAPLVESTRLTPTTFRGAAKAAATLIAQQLAAASHIPLVALRPFSVYGPWETPGRLVPTAIRASMSGMSMPLRPGPRHDLVFVEDVVSACLRASEIPGVVGSVLNIGTGVEWTNEEVLRQVQAVTGRPIGVSQEPMPARPADAEHWSADIRLAETMLGWRPVHTLAQGLERCVAWYQEHPDAW